MDTYMLPRVAMLSLISINIFKVFQKKIQVHLPYCDLFYFFFGAKYICFTYSTRKRKSFIYIPYMVRSSDLMEDFREQVKKEK